MHSFYEPTEMIITEDATTYYVNVIRRRQLTPVITLLKSEVTFLQREADKNHYCRVSTHLVSAQMRRNLYLH